MYLHTQRGTPILWAMGIASLVLIVILVLLPEGSGATTGRVAVIASIAVMVAAAWCFRSLTIHVAEGRLRWHFGSGLIHNEVSLASVDKVDVVRTSILGGCGIHLTRRGWLYNVSGRDAVCVRLRDGKQFVLGSDEPERLAGALEAARGPIPG